MENSAKKITILSYILSGILWLLGILTLLFNILGLWAAWHIAGYGFIFYIPVTIIFAIRSIVFSCISKETKFIVMNCISTAVSIGFTILTIFVSFTWFW